MSRLRFFFQGKTDESELMVSSHGGDVPIVFDDEVQRCQTHGEATPLEWHSRRLYVGESGAGHWLNIVRAPKYPLHEEDHYDLRKNRRAAIQGLRVETMVSLGPGDAHHDIELVEQLCNATSNLQYIPVDISAPLLKLSIANMSAHVEIPVGILCDFEQTDGILGDAVGEHGRRPLLISLLGGTIGNLDLGESHFLDCIARMMVQGDHLLIDVPLAGEGWSAEREPRLRKADYAQEFQRFLSGGLEAAEGVSEATFLREVESRLDCRLMEQPRIEGTRVISISDRLTHREILRFCRYDWRSFIAWVETLGFDLVFHRCAYDTDERAFGMGVILLARK